MDFIVIKGWTVLIATGIYGYYAIGISFLLVCYCIHPQINRALDDVRAAVGWRAVKEGRRVEITHHHPFVELLLGIAERGAAWNINLVRASIYLAVVGIELLITQEIVREDRAHIFDRPPPVFRNTTADGKNIWIVQGEQLNFDPDEAGTMGNFRGGLESGYAISRYRVKNSTYGNGEKTYEGSMRPTWWSDGKLAPPSSLWYKSEMDDSPVTLQSLGCDENKTADVYLGDTDAGERTFWGDVTECEAAPASVYPKHDGPPAIILASSNSEKVYVLVEENNNYPGFLYSVWDAATSGGTIGHQVDEVSLMFYVASEMRLVEAIVTGLVNGVETGGGCVDLLWQYSREHWEYDYPTQWKRALPFGEHPSSSIIDNIAKREKIYKWVAINFGAGACLLWVAFVFVVGQAWARSVRPGTETDIFNSYALIRYISLERGRRGSRRMNGGSTATADEMRMFARIPEGSDDLKVDVDNEGKPSKLAVWFSEFRRAMLRPFERCSAAHSRSDTPGNFDIESQTGGRDSRTTPQIRPPENSEFQPDQDVPRTPRDETGRDDSTPIRVSLTATPNRSAWSSTVGTPMHGMVVSSGMAEESASRGAAERGPAGNRTAVRPLVNSGLQLDRSVPRTPRAETGSDDRAPIRVSLTATPNRSACSSTVGTPVHGMFVSSGMAEESDQGGRQSEGLQETARRSDRL